MPHFLPDPAASVLFGLALRMVLFDRRSWSRQFGYSLFAAGAVYNPDQLLLGLKA